MLFFLLGATYLNLTKPPDQTAFMLLGSTKARAGLPVSMRVSATWASGRGQRVATVKAVTINNQPVAFEVVPGTPALVSFTTPANAASKSKLAIVASCSDSESLLTSSLEVYQILDRGESLSSAPSPLSKTKKTHRIDVLPTNGVLVMHMDNDVLVRVRDAEGNPVVGAEVEIQHEVFPGGLLKRRTDSGGLTQFKLVARRPSFRLNLKVIDGDSTTKQEVLLKPTGRNMQLTAEGAGVLPETPLTFSLSSWRAEEEVYCDLLADEVWLRTLRIQTDKRRNLVDFGGWPEGLYTVQCAEHPFAIGSAFGTLRIEVTPKPGLSQLLDSLEQGSGRGAGPRVMPSRAEDEALSINYWLAYSRPEPLEPSILVNTRPTIKADLESKHQTAQSQLLFAMAVVLGLVVIWVCETVLRHSLEVRDRLREFAMESLEAGDDDGASALVPSAERERQRLMNIQRVLAPALVIATLIGNAVALIWLFAFIR